MNELLKVKKIQIMHDLNFPICPTCFCKKENSCLFFRKVGLISEVQNLHHFPLDTKYEMVKS